MLAEIFMLRLEAAVRATKEAAATSSRFVPITLDCEGVIEAGQSMMPQTTCDCARNSSDFLALSEKARPQTETTS